MRLDLSRLEPTTLRRNAAQDLGVPQFDVPEAREFEIPELENVRGHPRLGFPAKANEIPRSSFRVVLETRIYQKCRLNLLHSVTSSGAAYL